MRLKRILHIRAARFKNLQQIPVTAFEVFQYLAQQVRTCFIIELKHPVDDMIGADLVRRVEIARFSRRLEGPDDDPCRIRAQIETLAI